MVKKRVQVTFSESQWKLIEKVKDGMGETDADAIRSIVVSWLAEKSLISTQAKEKMRE